MGTEKDDSVDLRVAEIAEAPLATSRPNHAALQVRLGGGGSGQHSAPLMFALKKMGGWNQDEKNISPYQVADIIPTPRYPLTSQSRPGNSGRRIRVTHVTPFVPPTATDFTI